MMTVQDLASEVVETWEGALDVRTLTRSDEHPDRLFGVDSAGKHVTVHLRITGPDYASAYRGWVTLRRGDRLAALAGRPDGYRVIYAMVGLAPDERVWWSALYEEDLLPVAEAESVKNDMFFRLRPDQVEEALILFTDHINLVLPWAEPTLPTVSPTKLIEAPIGSTVTMRGTVAKHNNGGSVTVDFGTIKWAVLGLTPVIIEK